MSKIVMSFTILNVCTSDYVFPNIFSFFLVFSQIR